MPLFADDVSEYVAPRKSDVATLVVEIDGSERKDDRRRVRAWVNDGPALTGQFAVSPELAQPSQARVQAPSKLYFDDTATSLGTRLFTALFSGGLSRCWAQAIELARSGSGLHLVIRSSDPSVQALPWELLIDPLTSAGPVVLADGWSVIRQPARPADVHEPGGMSVETKDLQVLVMTSDLAGIPQENDPGIITRALEGASIKTLQHITKQGLIRGLGEQYRHVVHVLALGGDRTRQGRNVLLLGSATDPEEVSAKEFVAALGEQAAQTRLVVLAACDSDLMAADLAEHLPNVVGIRGTISDEGCLAFLRGMYKALGSGSTIDQAVAAGRAQQVGFSQSLGEEWALPVLFQRDGTPLVHRQDAPEVPPEPIPINTSSGTPEEHADKILLDMKVANLRSLREQWSQVDVQSVPGFIREQIDGLEGEVQRITQRSSGRTR
jgi:hypothetical protein